jgi:hypothetical protein
VVSMARASGGRCALSFLAEPFKPCILGAAPEAARREMHNSYARLLHDLSLGTILANCSGGNIGFAAVQ